MKYHKMYLKCFFWWIVICSAGCQGNIGLLKDINDEEQSVKVRNIDISVFKNVGGLLDIDRKYRIRDKVAIQNIITFLDAHNEQWQRVSVVPFKAAQYAVKFNYQNKFFSIAWNDQELRLKLYESDYEQQYVKKLTTAEFAQYQYLLGIAPFSQNLPVHAETGESQLISSAR